MKMQMKKKKKEYQRPSVKVIETEAQQPLASSNVNGYLKR